MCEESRSLRLVVTIKKNYLNIATGSKQTEGHFACLKIKKLSQSTALVIATLRILKTTAQKKLLDNKSFNNFPIYAKATRNIVLQDV